MEIHQKILMPNSQKLKTKAKEKWSRVAGDSVALGEEQEFAVNAKHKVSVREETNAVSVTRVMIVQSRHQKLHPLSHQSKEVEARSEKRSLRGGSQSGKSSRQTCKNFLKGTRSQFFVTCNSSFGSMVSLDHVTPDTGYEPKDMELADTNERNLATSSDIYFQNALEDTASFPNVPDVDDDELAEFLAVVVNRTGQPVEVRSNSDLFSCDIRNLKSAQSQFLLVTQPKRMINQTGGSVEERIAEERECSNAQIRTMLDEQRRTIIAEYSEKVLHHELLAAQAEQNRRILQEELLRQQDFREVHQQDLVKMKELQKFQNSAFDEFNAAEVHRGSEDYYGIIWKTSRTAEWSKLHE